MSQRETRQQELDALLKMFSGKGWQIVENDLSNAMTTLMQRSWVECKTGEEFLERKGEIMALSKMLAFRGLIAQEVESFDDKVFPDEEQPDNGRNSLED